MLLASLEATEIPLFLFLDTNTILSSYLPEFLMKLRVFWWMDLDRFMLWS